MRKTLEDKLVDKLNFDLLTGCWVWSGAGNGKGYGQIGKSSPTGGNLYTHRVAYEMWIGPIPADMVLDHLCRNRACCNPTHLEPVTQAENKRRGMSNGATHHMAKLTREQAAEIRSRCDAGQNMSEMARQFGVSTTAIHYIATGRNWKSVAPEVPPV